MDLIDKALASDQDSTLSGFQARAKLIENENFKLRRDYSAAVLLLKGWIAGEMPKEQSQILVDSFKV